MAVSSGSRGAAAVNFLFGTIAMFRFFLALAVVVLPGEPAAAQPKLSDPISTRPIAPEYETPDPMVFYLARGEADACGPRCDEWIAAEGTIDMEALQRLRALLSRLDGRNPPIFFHSPGGFLEPAIAIGRFQRERGMTAGVARTIVAGCVGASDDTCRALKKSGEALAAELREVAGCNSACVFALIGAKVRQVPGGARLGVHQGKGNQAEFGGQFRAKSNAQVGRYLREMDIDDGLLDIILRVPNERMQFLTRDEIANFGIDAREFHETRWIAAEPRLPSIRKLIVEARGASRKEFRTSMLTLTCATQRVTVKYYRGLAADELAAGPGRSIKLTIDDRQVSFPQKASIARIDVLETGGSFETRSTQEPFEFFKAAAARDSIEIIESDPTDAARAPRIIKLSTAGLSKALEGLQKDCDVEPKFFDAPPALRLPEPPGGLWGRK
jgi:hypothetical protein